MQKEKHCEKGKESEKENGSEKRKDSGCKKVQLRFLIIANNIPSNANVNKIFIPKDV